MVVLMPSFVSSFLSASRRSHSLILSVEMFVIVVVPGVTAASTANVMTRSGVSPMSIVPRARGVGVPVILSDLFVWEIRQPMRSRYCVNLTSPWIEFFGRSLIVTVIGRPVSIDLRIAYSPRYEADDASCSTFSSVDLYFWFGATFRVRNDLLVSTRTPHFFINAIVISMYGRESSGPVICIVRPFGISGEVRSREVRYWLEIFPGIAIRSPVNRDGLMLIGGQPLFVERSAPSFVSASVSGLMGRSFIRFSPVIATSLLRQQASVVINLTAVPALPRWIFPGLRLASFLSPSRR